MNRLTLCVSPCALLSSSCPERQNLVFPCLFSPLSFFHQTSEDISGWSKVAAWEKTDLFFPFTPPTLAPDDTASKYYHLLCFHICILLWPERPQSDLKLLLLFNFHCIAFYLTAGAHTHIHSVQNMHHLFRMGLQSYIKIYTKCAVNDPPGIKITIHVWHICFNVELFACIIQK